MKILHRNDTQKSMAHGMTMKQMKVLKQQARNACIQFRYQEFAEEVWASVALMEEDLMQQISFLNNISLQEYLLRENVSDYQPLLQFISDDMTLTEQKDVAKMSRNDQEQFSGIGLVSLSMT